MQRRVEFVVPGELAGGGLAELLARRFPYHSCAGWCDKIGRGLITLNGGVAGPDSIVRAGDRVGYDVTDMVEPPVDFTVEIVAEDRELLVVSKSGNLPCHPSGRHFNHTLWAWLKSEYGMKQPYLVNRIDRETSGLVVVAKTREAAAYCGRQFSMRTVVRSYQVLVEGCNFPDKVECCGWMTSDTKSAVRKKRCLVIGSASESKGVDGGEWAETSFRLQRQCGEVALVEALPRTGRLHQIRASLLALGYPVVGDKLYGVDDEIFLRFISGRMSRDDRVRLRLERQALHATVLSMRHPADGGVVTYSAPLPGDMGAICGV